MDEPVPAQELAWQPLTPKGVANFAQASNGRVRVVQLMVALVAAASVVWFVGTDWFPIVRAAIVQLPEQGMIRGGKLELPGDWPATLAENRFLAFAVDPDHVGEARSPAHLAVEIGRQDLLLFSLLGYTKQAYAPEWNLPLNRTDLVPWWGAWAPPFLAIVGLGVVFWLMITWTLLAMLYAPFSWLIGFFANRDLTFSGSWRLASAALMPGALLLTLTIFAYGLGWLDLIRLAVAMALHFVVGWVYLVAATLAVPQLSHYVGKRDNPFAAPAEPPPPPQSP